MPTPVHPEVHVAVPKKKLGELLLELGLIDKDQLTAALAYQRQWGHRLGTSLVAKGFISEGTLIHVLSHSLGIPMVDLSQVQPQKDALRVLPANLCESHEIIPLAIEGTKGRRTLVLAMADPLNISVQEEVEFTTGCRVKPVIASFTAIGQAIRRWLRGQQVEIQATTYESPVRRMVSRGGDEPFTLVQPGGEEMVVRNQHPTQPPLPGAPPAFPVRPTPAAPVPAPFHPPVTNPQVTPPVAGAPGRTPTAPLPAGAFQPAAVMSQPQMSAPNLPPLPPLQGDPALPAFQAPPNTGASSPALPRLPVAPGYAGQPTAPAPVPLEVPQHDPVEELEKKFWALMRILARKGAITKEEFLKELEGS